MPACLPDAFGPAVLSASIRTTPEDFFVDELPGFAATGEGEHLLLEVEKRGQTTAAIAKRLAAWAGVPEMAIGFAGMKDRHAITRQRFSVHLPKRVSPPLESLAADGLAVRGSVWHHRKLPRGALAGNRFVLVLREVQGERDAIDARLRQIAMRGLPNWFGEQRFGRNGDNAESALAMFAGKRVRREERALLLSAARSELFNQVLAARVRAGNWDWGMEGEVWMLAGSRSVFGPELWSDALAARVAAFDIHPTGALWGTGEVRTQGECARLEEAALCDERSLALRAGLAQAGLKQERRALRLVPEGLAWTWQDHRVLALSFSLPPGSYATAVLHSLGSVTDASHR